MGNGLDHSELCDPSAPDAGVAVLHAPNKHPDLRSYDFRHPYRAAVHRTDLDAIHTRFASEFSASLSKRLRSTVEISPLGSDVLRYDEFLLSLDEPTCLSVLRVHPPGAEICLDLSLRIVHPTIDRLLGGNGDSPASRRALTWIEKSLAFQIVELAASALAGAWSEATRTDVHEREMESMPSRVQIMPDDETVTVVRFNVRVGPAGGIMTLCLPAPVLEHLAPAAKDVSIPSRGDKSAENDRQNMVRNLLDASIKLRAVLANTTMRHDDVLTLQIGDLLTTDTPANAAVTIRIDGANDLSAGLGHIHGTRAVRIIDGTLNDEPAINAAARKDHP